LRPSFSSSSLSPRTIRTPRLTCVSDGMPLRRLLILSKKWLFVVEVLRHGTPSFPNDNGTWRYFSVLARNRTWSASFAGSRANPAHSKDESESVPHQGVEPRLAVPKTAVLSGTLARHQYPDLDLNQGLDLRRVQCNPLHHRDKEPTTGLAPASAGLQDRRLSQSSHVGNQARAQGFEPCATALETVCSPRSTLAWVKSPAAVANGGAAVYFSSSTFQYASLTDFDQLTIRSS
jgi:hypothetical protein